MVETHKRVYGMRMTSSEKAEGSRYGSTFSIVPTPYPGCEFFREYKKHDRSGVGIEMVYNWTLEFVNSVLRPSDLMFEMTDVDWTDYKDWDLVDLTRNYLRAIYHTLGSRNKGVLVHCVSGWDRTPLFISLLRLSLWADGLIHQSLSEEEMLYFTLSYDWMLFSHQLSDRIYKKEEIMHFCFYFLQFIEEFDQLKEPPPDDENNEDFKQAFDLASHIDVVEDHFASPRPPVLDQSICDLASTGRKGIPIPAKPNVEAVSYSAHSQGSAGSWEVISSLAAEIGRRSRDSSVHGNSNHDPEDSKDSIGDYSGAYFVPANDTAVDPMLKIEQYSPSDAVPSALARFESKRKPVTEMLADEPTAFYYNPASSRKDRLAKVRELFMKIYSEVVDAHEFEHVANSSPSAGGGEVPVWDD
eukprot:TRINITY_DN1833_c0_g1_i2.p1 TRINITY_DN1833_c0_g1~~TRINITY_DN1833_c0_g1_i2.p1  ORF type:complete len:413 (+),score=71.43 TRINITY_DN1833_c0_g1_i2:894-2132(+)